MMNCSGKNWNKETQRFYWVSIDGDNRQTFMSLTEHEWWLDVGNCHHLSSSCITVLAKSIEAEKCNQAINPLRKCMSVNFFFFTACFWLNWFWCELMPPNVEALEIPSANVMTVFASLAPTAQREIHKPCNRITQTLFPISTFRHTDQDANQSMTAGTNHTSGKAN